MYCAEKSHGCRGIMEQSIVFAAVHLRVLPFNANEIVMVVILFKLYRLDFVFIANYYCNYEQFNASHKQLQPSAVKESDDAEVTCQMD